MKIFIKEPKALMKKLEAHGMWDELEALKNAKEGYDLSVRALFLSAGALIVSFVAGVIALIKVF